MLKALRRLTSVIDNFKLRLLIIDPNEQRYSIKHLEIVCNQSTALVHDNHAYHRFVLSGKWAFNARGSFTTIYFLSSNNFV